MFLLWEFVMEWSIEGALAELMKEGPRVRLMEPLVSLQAALNQVLEASDMVSILTPEFSNLLTQVRDANQVVLAANRDKEVLFCPLALMFPVVEKSKEAAYLRALLRLVEIILKCRDTKVIYGKDSFASANSGCLRVIVEYNGQQVFILSNKHKIIVDYPERVMNELWDAEKKAVGLGERQSA